MTAALDVPTGLDAVPAPGYRLARFEAYNWGTFHERAWVLPLDGENGLLTGDIGSGKSTLVDGLTALLAPAHKVVFNRAAGAERRERTLASYVRGHYKSARDEDEAAARAVALREGDTYSVLLARFENAALGDGVAIAQVAWLQAQETQPARFYVVAAADLAIAREFSAFGPDIKALKKRLRQRGAELFESFEAYATELRRRLGIPGEQALALFYQTVSMKSVGNLTEFVREHMLEPFPVQVRIDALIAHFDDLNRHVFAFAAYNAGPARVQKLRTEAGREGLDPNQWFNNVEIVAARDVGREPVEYVRNILKYWVAYQLAQEQATDSPPDRKQAALAR